MNITLPTNYAERLTAAWKRMEDAGWWHAGVNNETQIVRSPQGDIQEMSYAQIIAGGEALAPREIPDESRLHLGKLFIAAIVDPADYATSQAVWRKPVPHEGQLRGPRHINDIMLPQMICAGSGPESVWCVGRCSDTDLPRNGKGHVPMARRLLKRDGMRKLSHGDDLLILSLNDDGIIDMVRAMRSAAAVAADYGISEAKADEHLGMALEAAFDADQADYGSTFTACFHLPSGARGREYEMG